MTKRNILMISVFLGLMVLLGIGVSYSMWNISNIEDIENVISTTNCFDISITSEENSINLKNSYPISNEKGKKLTPFTFKVTNKCETAAKYSINLESLNGSTLSSEYLDIMLNNGEVKRLNSYSSANKVNSSSVESRELEIGILGNKESRDYSLRLWIDYDTTMEDLGNETKVFKSKIVIIGQPINYTGETVFGFDYTGSEQVFTVPVSGTYKLETWGGQGSFQWNGVGGYGGYSYGENKLKSDDKMYVNVGSGGTMRIAGYNSGGGKTLPGGGATHIATFSGQLSSLDSKISNIIIVAGGGGAGERDGGGSGGGYRGGTGYKITGTNYFAKGGTQSAGGTGLVVGKYNASQNLNGVFGQGGSGESNLDSGPSGGGGFYGGGGVTYTGSGGGGSGYIGNSLLKNKVMFCYNCEESSDENTKTISTDCSEKTPTSYCAKKGNGYARITLVSIDE